MPARPTATRPQSAAHMRRQPACLVLMLACLLPACDWLGVEPASQLAARKEAEGRALGAACRQATRGLEDCFAQYKRADKAAVFAGWREMNDYMRDNNMEPAAQAAPADALASQPQPQPMSPTLQPPAQKQRLAAPT